MEKRWGSGVTHSAHALKRPTHTHLWQIMGHVVTVYIPSCHSCGLKSPANTWEMCSSRGFFYCYGKFTLLLRLSGLKGSCPAQGSSVHMANGWRCVYTHPMLFHTRVHPASHVSLIVCPPLPLFTRRKLTSQPTLTSGHESNEAEIWHTLFHTRGSRVNAVD